MDIEYSGGNRNSTRRNRAASGLLAVFSFEMTLNSVVTIHIHSKESLFAGTVLNCDVPSISRMRQGKLIDLLTD